MSSCPFSRKKIVLAFAASLFLSPCFAEETSLTKDDVEKIVKELLTKKSPEIVDEAKTIVKQKKLDEKKTKLAEVISSYRQSIYERNGDPIGGNPQGDVTIVMFQDYRCGHCKIAHKILNELADIDKNIRIVYKEYPVLGPDSIYASKASLAALKQGSEKQFKFSEAMMASSDPVSKDDVLKLALTCGLNTDQLKNDIGSADVDHLIAENLKIARTLEVRGTPSFVIGPKGEEEVLTGVLEKEELEILVKKMRDKRVQA